MTGLVLPDDIEHLARELAAATGGDVETAVERALEERLVRLRPGTDLGGPEPDDSPYRLVVL